MPSGRNRIFFLRKITKRLYRYRGLSRLADLVRMAYIHSPLQFRIGDFDGDLQFDCALNEHISSQVFWRGDYSTGQLALLRKILKPGMVFLDAGANKGEFSLIAAKYISGNDKLLRPAPAGEEAFPNGRVLAFEPIEATAKALEANIAANGFSQVQVFRKALGKAAGERIIYHAADTGKEELNLGTFTLYPRAGLDQPCGKIGVLALDEMVGEIGLQAAGRKPQEEKGWTTRIDVMKIDIEGGELEMLEGARETIRRHRPVIFIEVNAITSRAAGYDQAELLRWLQTMGYRCERIGRKGKTFPVTIEGLTEFQNLVCWPGKEELHPQEGIAFFIPDLRGGGAERSVINLLKEMTTRPFCPPLDLVLVDPAGSYVHEIPESVRVFGLNKKRTLSALPGLVRYLRQNKPSVLIAHLSHANTIALLAKKIAGVDTRVIVVEHIVMGTPSSFFSKQGILEWGMKKWYPGAAERVAVSKSAAARLTLRLGLPERSVRAIYNPVVDNNLLERAKQPPGHPWLDKKEGPVFLAVGRLEAEKDFETLLDAFARLRTSRNAAWKNPRPVRLILLGEGSLRGALETRLRNLGIETEVSMPGFVENPFAYMARCDAFVLSSRSEGLSNVLIEALACGCPVISTDCPGGPREILEDGRFGLLTPVGDAEALAAAMEDSIEKDQDGAAMDVGKPERMQRALFFSSGNSADAWISLINKPRRRVVLHVITGLRTGGAERMLCRLLSALDRQRWEPVVISLTDGSSPETWLRQQGITVYCLGMRPGKWPSPRIAMKLIRLVRKIGPDLIQGWMYHGNLAASFANRFLLRRVPVIWSIHHSIASLAAEKNNTIRMIRLGARLSRLPVRIVYASAVSAAQHIALGYRAGKAMVIPYGIDPSLFTPSAGARAGVREEWGSSPADLLIGSLARYHPMKDHKNFILAAALLLQRYDGYAGDAGGKPAGLRFVLAGTGVDTDNKGLRSLIDELGIAGRVRLTGERQDAHRFLAALDIFSVSSSHGEALPLVLLEAMSCGLSCVTTDVGDAARAVGDTGRVVPPGDPEALAAAWAELIAGGEEKRKSLGEAARARVIAHYALSANASAYDVLYGEVVG